MLVGSADSISEIVLDVMPTNICNGVYARGSRNSFNNSGECFLNEDEGVPALDGEGESDTRRMALKRLCSTLSGGSKWSSQKGARNQNIRHTRLRDPNGLS